MCRCRVCERGVEVRGGVVRGVRGARIVGADGVQLGRLRAPNSDCGRMIVRVLWSVGTIRPIWYDVCEVATEYPECRVA